MNNTQLLLINDMCGYGKVALSAMLPVLSHMGYRIHNLPTALVSDTLNYPKFYIHDTTEYVRQSLAIWEELGFEFDAISTGFIVTEEETRIISDFCHRRAAKGTKVFCGPHHGRQRQALRGRARVHHRPHARPCGLRGTTRCPTTPRPACSRTPHEGWHQRRGGPRAGGRHARPGCQVRRGHERQGGRHNAVIGYDRVAGEHFSIPFELIPVYFPGTGDTFSSVLLGRVMAGWTLQRATADAMRVVSELITRNASQQDKSAGLPHRGLSGRDRR